MKSFITLLLILSSVIGRSQDVITKSNGDSLKAHVIEVTQTELKYKRQESPDGPLYTISKSDVLSVRYKDGTQDVFIEGKTSHVSQDTQSNAERLKKGKRVYVTSISNASKIHGKEALERWDYWRVVERVEDADIIVNIKIQQHGLAYSCFIEILNPRTNEVILVTEHTASYAADDGNPKQGSIIKNVQQKLIPLIKNKNGN